MLIGVPKEVKNNESRVAMTPAGVNELVRRGHKVMVEKSAGVGSGFSDTEYVTAGAEMVDTAMKAWSAELVVKVKEPIAQEYDLMVPGQLLFTYLHLAAMSGHVPVFIYLLNSGRISYQSKNTKGRTAI